MGNATPVRLQLRAIHQQRRRGRVDPLRRGRDRLPPHCHDGRPDHGAAAAHLRQRPGDLERPGQQRDVRDLDRDLGYAARDQPQRQPPDHSVLLRGGAAQQRRRPDRRLLVLRQCPGQRRAQSRVADIITNGNIVWNGPGGDAAGVATDQQGTGTLYQYFWPCCGGGDTNFFQVNGIGPDLRLAPGQRWPTDPRPAVAVHRAAPTSPSTRSTARTSSSARLPATIFTTTNEGVTWFDVGDPAVFGNPGTFSVALAYGAPDPTAPEGIGNLGNFIYVGTANGQIYVTQDGGGSGTSNNWINISLGLDGSPVESDHHRPHPRQPRRLCRHQRLACSIIADSILLANNPANTATSGSTSPATSRPWPTASSARPTTRRPTRTRRNTTRPSHCPRSWPTGATPSPTLPPTPTVLRITLCCTLRG